MVSDKDRLYIALYARQDPTNYHWAFLLCTKKESPDLRPWRYHVKNAPPQHTTDPVFWIYEGAQASRLQTQLLLVLLAVAKIKLSRQKLEESLRKVPVIQANPRWTCRIWVRNALAQLVEDDALGTKVAMVWNEIERARVAYVSLKKQQGRFTRTPLLPGVPTKDLIEDRETMP